MPSERDNASEDGPSLAVIFEVIGEDRGVLTLPERTGCPSYGTPAEVAPGVLHAAVIVVHQWETQDRAAAMVVDWLAKNHDFLRSLNARKTLEFESRIFPEEGSASLRLPADLLVHVAEASCDIRHQYIRVPTDEELRRFQS